MKNKITVTFLVLFGVSCSTPDKLKMPAPHTAPINWTAFSMSTIPGTDCPIIEGTYLDPPSIFRSADGAKNVPKDNLSLYSAYIPFHRADRRELGLVQQDMLANSFIIRQPEADEFYFLYFAKHINSLVEYYFQSSEGDFECRDGHIEFPRFTSYGMIEGISVNFQIRNILLKDEKGALVIQSTRGPYRKNIMKSKNTFTDEFYRYELAR